MAFMGRGTLGKFNDLRKGTKPSVSAKATANVIKIPERRRSRKAPKGFGDILDP
jgi:hypothetical protein